MEQQSLWNSSKLIKYWPSLLIGFLAIWIIKYIFRNRNPRKANLKLDGEDDIAVEFTEPENQNSGLVPALEQKPHVNFHLGQSLNPRGARRFYDLVRGRRSIRSFNPTSKPDITIIEDCIRAAGTSPSGAHTEPWTFCVVEKYEVKQAIRKIVEHEEQINYSTRMHAQWVTDLLPLRTKPIKQYLTDAPYLVLIFKQTHGITVDGRKKMHYYNEISTSMSAGILLCALQAAGICSLVTTPLNCGSALRHLLERPMNEKLLILLAVGYAADDCKVPDLDRKHLNEILVKY